MFSLFPLPPGSSLTHGKSMKAQMISSRNLSHTPSPPNTCHLRGMGRMSQALRNAYYLDSGGRSWEQEVRANAFSERQEEEEEEDHTGWDQDKQLDE